MKEIHNNDLKQQLMSESAFKDCFSTDVSADTRLFHFLARDYIVQEGQQPSWLFYLTRGRARLYVTLANGRVSLIDFFAAPCFIGEIELIDKDHEPRAVQAIEECWCLALPMKHYRPLLLNDTLFLRKLCVTLSHKNYRNIVSLTQNQSFPLVNRLAAFILLSQPNRTGIMILFAFSMPPAMPITMIARETTRAMICHTPLPMTKKPSTGG